jgi:hypothetical protein
VPDLEAGLALPGVEVAESHEVVGQLLQVAHIVGQLFQLADALALGGCVGPGCEPGGIGRQPVLQRMPVGFGQQGPLAQQGLHGRTAQRGNTRGPGRVQATAQRQRGTRLHAGQRQRGHSLGIGLERGSAQRSQRGVGGIEGPPRARHRQPGGSAQTSLPPSRPRPASLHTRRRCPHPGGAQRRPRLPRRPGHAGHGAPAQHVQPRPSPCRRRC